MILSSIDNLTLDQMSYIELIRELDLAKVKALAKLKSEDPNVRKFVESKMYYVLKSNIVQCDNKYKAYLKTVTDYKDCITEEVFDTLMKEG